MPQILLLQKRNGFYELDLFKDYRVRAIFTSRKYDMAFERTSGSTSLGRREAYRELGVNWEEMVCPSQVHGDKIFVAEDRDRGRGIFERSTAIQDTDAVITSQTNLPIGILTADCLPVFIFDTEHRCGAVVHAGWKGIHKRLISKTVRRMTEEFDTSVSSLAVALGPAIRACCYAVGEDFLARFGSEFIEKRKNKLFFDMVRAVCSEFMSLNVEPGQIYDSRICTYCMGNEFFSFRREGNAAGRSMSVMEIK